MQRIGLYFFILIMFSGNVSAGWVIKEETYFSDQEGKEHRTVYAEGTFIKLEEKGLTTIIDVARDKIIFYNSKAKTYWAGTLDDYDREMIDGMRQKFLGTISSYNDSARAIAIESFEKMARQLMNDSVEGAEKLFVQVSQTKNGSPMFGYPTRIYMVWVNKVATEEVWVAPDVQLFREPVTRHYWEMFNRITRYYEKGFHYQADPKYLYLMTRGYPVKVKEFGFRYDVITEVTRIKHKKLPDSVFRIPSGANRVRLSKLNL
ncbi:MAG: hypothetical protein GXO83_10920 [Chlorobi bacterium]|nr:hypothetical protein [Chlorobiota bacterium]